MSNTATADTMTIFAEIAKLLEKREFKLAEIEGLRDEMPDLQEPEYPKYIETAAQLDEYNRKKKEYDSVAVPVLTKISRMRDGICDIECAIKTLIPNPCVWFRVLTKQGEVWVGNQSISYRNYCNIENSLRLKIENQKPLKPLTHIDNT